MTVTGVFFRIVLATHLAVTYAAMVGFGSNSIFSCILNSSDFCECHYFQQRAKVTVDKLTCETSNDFGNVTCRVDERGAMNIEYMLHNISVDNITVRIA